MQASRQTGGRTRLHRFVGTTVQVVARLVHLNGPPGIGKSTIARRYVQEHVGVLNCDVDVLRGLVGGWATDFVRAGALIRPAALAMISAYLEQGEDVVLPQMLADPAELIRFEQAAVGVGAEFVERVLMDAPDAAVRRFNERGREGPEDPWHDQVRDIVRMSGGDESLLRYHALLSRLVEQRPKAIVIHSIEGAVEDTYRAFVDSLH